MTNDRGPRFRRPLHPEALDTITRIMAELALDDVQRHALAGEFERVRVAQLVRRESPSDAGARGEPTELAADGGA